MSIKLLVVDDDKCSSEIFKAYLSYKDDWEVKTTEDATKALQLMKEEEFDVVVSDMRMEPVNGLMFLSSVSDQFPKVVRILFSAYELNKEKPSYVHYQYEKGKFSMTELVEKVTSKINGPL